MNDELRDAYRAAERDAANAPEARGRTVRRIGGIPHDDARVPSPSELADEA